MPPLYDKTCAHCGRVHTGTRAELARMRRCEGCGEDLPAAMTVHAEHAVGGGGASPAPAPAPAPGTPVFELTCPACGHRHTGTREELAALGYCEGCGDFLTGARPVPVAGGAPMPRPRPSGTPVRSSAELRLHMVDADVNETLPRAEGEAVFGRLTAEHPTLASLRTLSRKQFAYSYREDGSLEIRNLSRFGTTVSGRRLMDANDVAVVSAPAVIEMAGHVFELEGANG